MTERAFRSFTTTHPRGPRHPLGAALMILAAVVDGRVPIALVAIDKDQRYRFVTGGDFAIRVQAMTFPPDSSIRLAIVDEVTLPGGDTIEINISEDALDDLLLPLIDQGVLQ